MSHLLVTNDFAPKVGGIQTYLWELWRRLPAAEATVLTTPYTGAVAWDRSQSLAIERVREPVLVPRPSLVRRIRRAAAECGASLVVLDPALPLGLVGPHLGLPYALVLHGAEVAVPGRLPVTRRLLAHVLGGARGIIAAGAYPAAEAKRLLRAGARPEVVNVPPGVDAGRFHPLDDAGRAAVRERYGWATDRPLVVCAGRLVRRKGIDVLLEATTRLAPAGAGLTVAVVGHGRDARRLQRVAGRQRGRISFTGRVTDEELADIDAAADVFVMLCRDRWGGLEREGFGIVFLEAAACGVPQVAGASGGAADAVENGVTGIIVGDPRNPAAAAAAIAGLLGDEERRRRMGTAARRRAEEHFSWDVLALSLGASLRRWQA